MCQRGLFAHHVIKLLLNFVAVDKCCKGAMEPFFLTPWEKLYHVQSGSLRHPMNFGAYWTTYSTVIAISCHFKTLTIAVLPKDSAFDIML